jgi:biotin synthase-related radical SAM superfamily protein
MQSLLKGEKDNPISTNRDNPTKILLYNHKGLCVQDIPYIRTSTQTKIEFKHLHTTKKHGSSLSCIVITEDSIRLVKPINLFS